MVTMVTDHKPLNMTLRLVICLFQKGILKLVFISLHWRNLGTAISSDFGNSVDMIFNLFLNVTDTELLKLILRFE